MNATRICAAAVCSTLALPPAQAAYAVPQGGHRHDQSAAAPAIAVLPPAHVAGATLAGQAFLRAPVTGPRAYHHVEPTTTL